MADQIPAQSSGDKDPRVDLFAGFADCLMAAGDQLAKKLRDIDDSPWTQQILEEWAEAKTSLTDWL